jgi:23S rRNA (uridine2552-2'-O)-methyltransferase
MDQDLYDHRRILAYLRYDMDQAQCGARSGHPPQSDGKNHRSISQARVRGNPHVCLDVGSRKPEQAPMTRDDSRRPLKVQVKSGRGRTLSSKLWLDRQLNDPYVARARREGFRSRAAYKLIEIDDKQSLLRLGASVVDLGAAPGGWSQVVAKRVGAAEGRGHVVAIDLLDMMAIPGVEFVQLDFLDASAPDAIKGLLGGPADLVLSDMAANATGHRATDHIKIMALAEAAAEMAHDVLKPGGAFLCKVLQGGTESTLLAQLKKDFAAVKHVKPSASRADSAELYLLARGFRAR